MSDYPDFTLGAYVDIVDQTYDQLIQRYKKGHVASWDLADTSPADNLDNLLLVSGRGIIHNLNLQLSGRAGTKDSSVVIYVDTVAIIWNTFQELYDENFGGDVNGFLSLTCFDPVNFLFTVSLCRNLTFETAIGIWCYPNGGIDTHKLKVHVSTIT